jgi:NAD(P)-dependent dehydrogenase (short-subunit alcohol dehydrogenase family)
MTSSRKISVYGAYGHTGRFIVSELCKRGWKATLLGRDIDKLRAVASEHGGLEVRAAFIDDPVSLDDALTGSGAVINCAGPFAFTAAPIMEAALRAKISYFDVVAEPEIAAAAFQNYTTRAQATNIIIAPALGFYGGLGNLLATATMGNWAYADEISLAYALNSWKPTAGTRTTIHAAKERRGGKRLVFSNGHLQLCADEGAITTWTFPEPIGVQTVVAEFTTADSVTMSQHLKAQEIHEYMTLAPLKDLSDPDLSPPPIVDASGRSAQTFLIETVIRQGNQQRRGIVSGRDIYAITAPIVVEAMERALRKQTELSGVLAISQITTNVDIIL